MFRVELVVHCPLLKGYDGLSAITDVGQSQDASHGGTGTEVDY